jgi:hypothetical protein
MSSYSRQCAKKERQNHKNPPAYVSRVETEDAVYELGGDIESFDAQLCHHTWVAVAHYKDGHTEGLPKVKHVVYVC